MHRIVSSHLDKFAKSFGFEKLAIEEQFERFCSYSIIGSKSAISFEIEDVTTGAGDDGTDSVAVIIDEEIITSDKDADSAFSSARKNHDVELIFLQSKTSESFDLGDFLKFKESVLRFVTEENYIANDDIQCNARQVFDSCISNVHKIRNGKPKITIRFIATGNYLQPQEFQSSIKKFEKQLKEIGYFSEIDVKCLGRNELIALWVATYSGVSAQLPLLGSTPLPSISGVDEAYIAVARAKDFVENLLKSDDGTLRSQVFEENVRAYLGSDNSVNESISQTLLSKTLRSRFPVLNNGITIVSPDVRIQGNNLHLDNYQIVNGCQTSNLLYENRDSYDDSVTVTLKIVETSNEEVFSDLVRATNSQTKVDETQFLSLKPIIKQVEKYFNTFEGADSRIYFERREKQFAGKDVPAIRIFNINAVAKCVASMFFERPDLAYRYQKTMYDTLSENIFDSENKEIAYYAACLTLYRLHSYVASNSIPQNMRKYKWHMLPLIRTIIAGRDAPPIKSKKITAYSQKIIDTLSQPSPKPLEPFKRAVEIISELGEISDDRLKRQAVLEEMLQRASGRVASKPALRVRRTRRPRVE